MAIDLTVFATDLTNVIADMPADLTWGQQTISGMHSELRQSDQVEAPGFLRDASLTFQAKVTSFSGSTLPNPGDKVTLGGVEYRIVSAMKSPDAVMAELVLEDPAS